MDVTPHTFNNLIKTIANHRSVSNASRSKTEFEERIREIILAFNPNLKKSCPDMSTEYLLISCLKVGDKKEVTHNYNYNTWGGVTEGEAVDDKDDVAEKLRELGTGEWDSEKLFDLLASVRGGRQYAKNVRKSYQKYVTSLNERVGTTDVSLPVLKGVLGVKKLDADGCTTLFNCIRQLLDRWCDSDASNNTVEGVVYGLRSVFEKLKSFSHQLDEKETVIKNLEEQLADATYERSDIDARMCRLANESKALNERIAELNEQCERHLRTIDANAIDLAMLGADVGHKDDEIEHLRTMCDELKRDMELAESARRDFDVENTNLLCKVSRLTSEVNELKNELEMEKNKIQMYENQCRELVEKIKKYDDDRHDGQQQLAALTQQTNSLISDKHQLTIEIDQARESINQWTLNASRLKEQLDIMKSQCARKEQELAVCAARLVDTENNRKDTQNHLTSKLTEYLAMNTELNRQLEQCKSDVRKKENELQDLYNDDCVVIEEKSKLLVEVNKLKMRLEEVEKKAELEREQHIATLAAHKEEAEERVDMVRTETRNKLLAEFEKQKDQWAKNEVKNTTKRDISPPDAEDDNRKRKKPSVLSKLTATVKPNTSNETTTQNNETP